ncbi:MAG: hypothetical protein KA715_07880 [Xanthomonadaceae bacterium]|nr:hypothetical protein [Xanthomonadaceae bacterium]
MKTSLIVCIPENAPPSLAELEVYSKDLENIEFLKTNTIAAAVLQTQKASIAVCLICVSEKSDLVSLMSLLETTSPEITAGTLRVIAINKLAHEKIPLMLKGKGCFEVLDFKVGKKEFNFKLNNYIKLARQAHNRLVKDAELSGSDVSKKSLSKIAAKNNQDGKTVISWDKQLDHSSDFWLITNKKNIRNVLGQWLIQILGPGPASGSWEKSELTLGKKQGWEWKVGPQFLDTFKVSEGRWIFFGREPEFSWKDNLWSLVSRQPVLAYYVENEPTAYRMISEDPKRLLITENSKHGNNFLEAIQKTIDNLKTFKDEKKKSSAFDDLIDEELDKTHPADVTQEAPKDSSINDDQMYRDFNTGSLKDARQDEEELPWKAGADAMETLKLELFVKQKNSVDINPPILVELIEVQDHNIILDIPAGSVNLSDLLNIDVCMTEGKTKNETTIEVVADHFESEEEEGRIMVLAYTTDDRTRKKVKNILDIYIKKQQFLLDFLTAAKG